MKRLTGMVDKRGRCVLNNEQVISIDAGEGCKNEDSQHDLS
ncbi:hypothetical protein ACJROX_10175 [Pseudalkalibacillus sp. A8]